ncbi:crystal protein-like [Dysidea avara]|uniref:crystal protein-like n=1 Tax=Dysidea avara TaxID=196820 RepID=UPI003327F720
MVEDLIRHIGGGLLYDGQYIANHTNVILVTINYRLGALGFLVYGSNQEIGGNYGLKDQRFALKWVQENITYFGGNPDLVTIFGQSTGGVSVAAHMSSVKSSGLFHRGIIESNSFGVPIKGLIDSMSLGFRFAKQVGCGENDVSCVKGKSVDAIVDAETKVLAEIIDYDHPFQIFLQWTPYMDGIEIDEQPLKHSEKEELLQFQIGSKQSGSVGEEAYPYTMETFTKPITTIGTDNPFWCPTRYIAAGFANFTSFPVWVYNFDHAASFEFWAANASYCDGHTCHGEEIAFLIHNAPLAGFHYTKDEEKLSEQIITYWTNFARYGNPNGANGNLDWPQYTSYTKSVLRFLTPKNKVEDYRSDFCIFWDQIGYNV